MNCVICNKPVKRKHKAVTCSDPCLYKLRSIQSSNALKLKRKEKPIKYINYYENEEDVVEKILESL